MYWPWLYHLFGFSGERYAAPVLVNGRVPKTYLQLGFKSAGHTGPFAYAEDFLIPNPEDTPLPVLAPASGTIVALVQRNLTWGPSKLFAKHLNFVTVQITGYFGKPGAEFYELSHIGYESCPYPVGARIKKGEQIAATGLNGWTTETQGVPDYHLHFMVGMWLGLSKFTSLRIRYE